MSALRGVARRLAAFGPARAASTLWIALVLVWIARVAGLGSARRAAQILALATFLATAWWLAAAARRTWRAGTAGRALLAVVAGGLAIGLLGTSHEVGEGTYLDEGHYIHHARRIDDGQPFTSTFVYPHLQYEIDGFALWLVDLFPAPVRALAGGLAGVGAEEKIPWLVLRGCGALLGALTVWPVFLAAQAVAGPFAGVVAAALVASSPLYKGGFAVHTCDVPAAFFAAWSVAFAIRIVVRGERRRDYALAGLAAGLAAATKYPAGVVAIAVVVAWGVERLRTRRWSWGLILAGAVALAAFLAVNPSLFVFPREALFGGKGIFFGARQYGQGGWIGVVKESNALFYAGRLLDNFGVPAAVLLALGLVAWPRRRWAETAPAWGFVLLFFALLCAMNMAVVRNLFPILPALAILAGVALADLAAWRPLAPARRGALAAALAVVLVVAALALPLWRTALFTFGHLRPSTRQEMRTWMREHLPRGSHVLKETYTPNFDAAEFFAIERRNVPQMRPEWLTDPRWDLLIVADSMYQRYFRDAGSDDDQLEDRAAVYRRLFAELPLVHEVDPEWWQVGPRLRLLRLASHQPHGDEPDSLGPDTAFVPDAVMQRRRELLFSRAGQWVLFRPVLTGGSHHAIVRGALLGGEARLVTWDNRELARLPVASGGAAELTLVVPAPDKYFLYLDLEPGSRVSRLELGEGAPAARRAEPASPRASVPESETEQPAGEDEPGGGDAESE